MFFSCRDLSRNVERIEAPETPAFHRLVARVHLAGCSRCARFVVQHRATVAALKELAEAARGGDERSTFRAWNARRA